MDAVAHVRDRGVGGRGRRRRPAHGDDLGPTLRDARDELVVEPRGRGLGAAEQLRERVGHRTARDGGVRDVGELGRGVVAPDREAGEGVDGCVELRGQLRGGAVVVEAGERREALRGDVGGRCRGDERVGVRGVPHHDDAHVVGRRLVERGALRAEDPGVGGEEVAALHARGAGTSTHQQGVGGAVERGARVVGHLDALQERERAVLQLEGGALGRADPLRDLQESQAHPPVGPEHRAAGDAEEQRVADLPARAGDGDGRGGRRGRGIHGPSLFPAPSARSGVFSAAPSTPRGRRAGRGTVSA